MNFQSGIAPAQLIICNHILGNQEVQDYQGRTPLHLASELDRTSAAESLISLPEPAEVRVQDNIGNIAIASMTRTMPGVVSQL